jgi:hypothetical protein
MPWASLPIAGVVVEIVSGAAATMLLATGFLAGALRALAVLRKFPAEQVEWLTAVGFAAGLVFGILVLILDQVIG